MKTSYPPQDVNRRAGNQAIWKTGRNWGHWTPSDPSVLKLFRGVPGFQRWGGGLLPAPLDLITRARFGPAAAQGQPLRVRFLLRKTRTGMIILITHLLGLAL